MSLLFSSATLPFGVAVALMLGLAVLEAVGLAVSVSPSHVLESLLADADSDALGWLHIGRTPLMVLMILFLAGFGLSGYLVQGAASAITGRYAPVWLAAPVALLVGVGAVRTLGGVIGRLVPRDESASVSEQTLIGRAGVVYRGDAKRDFAAEARVRDSGGAVHYLMVEPDIDGEILEQGADILLVRKLGARFRAIRNPHPEVL